MLGLAGAKEMPVKAQDNYFWSFIMLFPFLMHMALQMGLEMCKEPVLLLHQPLPSPKPPSFQEGPGDVGSPRRIVPFLIWEFPNCAADWNSGAWGWLAAGRTVKLPLVEDKRLFVCPNLGNSAFPACPRSDSVVKAAAKALSERKRWMMSCRAAQ